MLAMPCLETSSCTHQCPCVGGDIVSWAIRTWGGYVSYAMPGNHVLHSPVTLPRRRYCFLGYSDLGGVISYARAMPIFWGKVTALTSDPGCPAVVFP